MSIDPYASCPCGSGKKFKWCCQAIHSRIEAAFAQVENGQAEAALATIAAVVKEHAGNPEAHGRHAQILHINGRAEEAEAALAKAFAINPDYAFGYVLRGMFRQSADDPAGALAAFRQASELYSPDAREALAFVYESIGDIELKRNRPVAARFALMRAIRHAPPDSESRQAAEMIFGEESRLPESARREYRFLAPKSPPPEWGKALDSANSGRLSDARTAFEGLTKSFPDEPAGWFNLGLVLAWQGENATAIEAISEYVEREPDEEAAARAWALAEVLRLGAGLEDDADFRDHRRLFRFRDPNALIGILRGWEEAGRLIGLRSNPDDQMLSALVLQEVTTLAVVGAAVPVAPLGAYLLVVGDVIRLSNTDEAAVDKVADQLRERLGASIAAAHSEVGPAQFGDVTTEALAFPTGRSTQLDVQARMREHARRFFEEVWFHRPLRSLNGVPPVDAAGHRTLRKKLAGVVVFLEESLRGGAPRLQREGQAGESVSLYDFSRLRRKLGLLEGTVPEFDAGFTPMPEGSPAPAAPTGPDFESMGAAELAGVGVPLLSDEELDRAFRAAVRLDAQDLAARFARAGVARAANPDRPDRFSWFDFLIRLALGEGDTLAALQRLDEAEKADTEANSAKRTDDYQLRRAQIHAKRGEDDAAASLFDAVIGRSPKELTRYSRAAEAMLGRKHKAHASRYAEAGLAKARELNNRDAEGQFLELSAAARKLSG